MQYSQSFHNPHEDSKVDNEAEDGDTEDNEAEEVRSSTTRDAN
jgi:hypothetical protein